MTNENHRRFCKRLSKGFVPRWLLYIGKACTLFNSNYKNRKTSNTYSSTTLICTIKFLLYYSVLRLTRHPNFQTEIIFQYIFIPNFRQTLKLPWRSKQTYSYSYIHKYISSTYTSTSYLHYTSVGNKMTKWKWEFWNNTNGTYRKFSKSPNSSGNFEIRLPLAPNVCNNLQLLISFGIDSNPVLLHQNTCPDEK